MSNQQVAIQLIKGLMGQANILTIPRIFVDFMGSLDGALFLSQCLYWSDRTNNIDGWFYKTYDEWQDEICLSKYEVTKHRKKMEELGFLQTDLKKANGAPTVHYKILFDDFLKSFGKFLDNRKLSNLTNDCQESNQSLTETTTETKQKKGKIPSFVPLAEAIASICKINLDKLGHRSKTELSELLANFRDITPDQIHDFNNWRIKNHWTGKDPATLKQIGDLWGQYESWVEAGRQQPASNGNGKQSEWEKNIVLTPDGKRKLVIQ